MSTFYAQADLSEVQQRLVCQLTSLVQPSSALFVLCAPLGVPVRRQLAACMAALFQLGDSYAALFDALQACNDVLKLRADAALSSGAAAPTQPLLLNAKLYAPFRPYLPFHHPFHHHHHNLQFLIFYMPSFPLLLMPPFFLRN